MSSGLDLVPVKPTTAIVGEPTKQRAASKWFRLLVNDRVATVAAAILGFVILTAIFGPMLVGDLATKIDLDNSNQAPFTFAHGWANFLGTDPLGRSMLARLIVACQTTLSVAIPAVVISAIVGSAIGMWAGYYRGWRETVAMRVADVIMSFPSLLLAVVVLYVFSPSAANIVLVLAITRIPVYLRTARAESAELQSRLFVDAARTFGASATVHHLPPRPADRAADAADRRDAGLLLRHARRVLIELPGHRHPAARRQLGPDGRRRAAPTCTPRGGCRSSPAWPSSSPPCRPPSWRPGPASPPIPGSGGASPSRRSACPASPRPRSASERTS